MDKEKENLYIMSKAILEFCIINTRYELIR